VLNSTPRIPVADPVQQNRLDRDQKRKLVRREFKPGQFAEIFRSRNDPGYVDLEVLAVGFATDASGKKGSGFPWPLQQAAPVPSNPPESLALRLHEPDQQSGAVRSLG